MPPSRTLRWYLFMLSSSALLASPALAQEYGPSTRGLLGGYGAVGYSSTTQGDQEHNFTATLSPLFLHQVGSDILVEGEFDIELEGGVTETHLEHAQIHYLGLEHLQFTAGMFHVPFGIWMHANWVNRMPTPPLLYEDSHGAPPAQGLLPILFDVGAMARASLPLIDGWKTSAAFWVSQGPASGIEGHGHGEEEPPQEGQEEEPVSDAPQLGYGGNFEDNNSDKMVGLQLRAISAGGLTLQASGFRAAYDPAGDFGVKGLNLSLIWTAGMRARPLFAFRGEGILLSQEYEGHEPGEVESVDYGGYYLQLSRRIHGFEPVVRWSHLPRVVAGEGPLVHRRRQLAVGLNYWISPSVPVKLAYNIERDGTDGLFFEWAVGF